MLLRLFHFVPDSFATRVDVVELSRGGPLEPQMGSRDGKNYSAPLSARNATRTSLLDDGRARSRPWRQTAFRERRREDEALRFVTGHHPALTISADGTEAAVTKNIYGSPVVRFPPA